MNEGERELTRGARTFLNAAAKMSPGKFASLMVSVEHGRRDGFVLLWDVKRAFPGEMLSPDLVRAYLSEPPTPGDET